MSRYAESLVTLSNAAHYTGGGVPYVIGTPNGDLYIVALDQFQDVTYYKSSDGGKTWGPRTTVKITISATVVSVWYDRWSGIDAGLIHIVWAASGDDDIRYNSIDTENSDTLGTETVVFAGSTTAGGGALSITRARGGNLVVAGSIDAGAEDGAWLSDDVGATWGAIADPSEAATQDQYFLLPGWNADTQDVMLIFWDASANEISVKRYDDSGTSWAETSIATSMTDRAAATDFSHLACTVDLANSQNIIIAWSAVDAASASLRCWTITDSAITEKTAVVSSSTDDQGLAALSIDTNNANYWTAYYAGATDGSEIFNTVVNVYYKISQDAGTTWGAESLVTPGTVNIRQLFTAPRTYGNVFKVAIYDAAINVIRFEYDGSSPRASLNLGI